MYNISYYNLQELCRICLKQLQAVAASKSSPSAASSSVSSHNLHSQPQLAFLLKLFVSLDVLTQPYRFPNSICQQCYSTLRVMEQLRDVAQRSEQTLHRIAREALAKEGNPTAALQQNTTNEDDQLLLPELLSDALTSVKTEPCETESTAPLELFNCSDDARATSCIKTEPTEHEDTERNTTIRTTKFEDSYVTNYAATQGKELLIKDEPLDYEIDEDDADADEDDLDDYYDDDEHVEFHDNTAADDDDDDTFDMVYTSSSLDEIASHKNNGRTLKCNHCDKQAYKLVYLEAHIRAVHEGHDKPFLCNRCSKCFTRYKQLHEHIRGKHPNELFEDALEEAAELICELCDRKYSSKRALRQHLKRHAQIKEYVCEHCGVGKVTRTELQIHLRTHQPDGQKFKCTQCPQLFNHKNAISRHIRVVHEGERRFKCDYCKKCFGTRNSLKRHQMLHSELRPFPCEMCNKRFTHEDRLITHMRSHDKNTWRYECRYCAKRCISRQNLVAHERRHVGDKPHICTVCFKGFANISDLERHKQIPCSERNTKVVNDSLSLQPETII